MTVADYSQVTAGRTARLARLDEALAVGQYAKARELALREWQDSEELLLWIEAKIEREGR